MLYEGTAAITGLGRFWRVAAARGAGGQGQARAGPGSSESVMVVLMRFLLRVGQGYLCSSVRFAMCGATGFERAIVKVFAPDFKLYHEWSAL